MFSVLDERLGEKERAPLLAMLEVDLHIAEAEMSGTLKPDEWITQLQRYWDRWGSKGCVVSELEGIIGKDEVRTGKLVEMMRTRTTERHVSLAGLGLRADDTRPTRKVIAS